MTRRIWLALVMSAGLALRPGTVPLEAQIYADEVPRFELVPFAGYLWGGSFDTDASTVIPGGELSLKGSFGWGVIMSFLAQRQSALELTYMRQDTDVRFDPDVGESRELGGFATNYIHIGGRQEFSTSGGIRPFISASGGLTVFDPKAEDIGTSTRFSFSLGAGAQYMLQSNQRMGFRTDIKFLVTPVPSGEYGGWCDIYGCVAVEGVDWVTQGQITGGVVFAF